MAKSLVIVESPNKVKTIKKYLGNDYIVTASVGHIRNLPTNSKFAESVPKSKKDDPNVKLNYRAFKMGINPFNWDGDFQIMKEKEKVVADLKKAAKDCDQIFLATDLDREGEAIAWHLEQVLGKKYKYKRVIFNEITESAIKKAFKNPTDIDLDRVHAQQTRRYLDRLVGFLVSSVLWNKVGKGLSAGRVQSVAMRLIVEKEREIRAFKPTNFWKIFADYTKDFKFELVSINGKKLTSPDDEKAFYLNKEEDAITVVNLLKNKKAIIKKVEIKDTSVKPKAPFTTSSLQQAASTSLGFSIGYTMSLAQSLYESGTITYIRTDSTNLSDDALKMGKSYILSNFGEDYLSKEKRVYQSTNTNSQEAHEAIRPSKLTPSSFKSEAERKLYNLIKARFLASQMENAIFQNTSIECEIEGDGKVYTFKCSGRLLKFAGFYEAFGVKADELIDKTGGLEVDNEIKLKGEAIPKQTQPPARYSESTLVKELEKRSIGRPSTYVSIISTIEERGYVTRDKNKKFHSTKIAEIVNDRLGISFNNIVDYDFTAFMEGTLDDIAAGKKEWTIELDKFWKELKEQLVKAELDEKDGGMPSKDLVETDFTCPKCNEHKMSILCSHKGNFLSCDNHDTKEKDRCKNTMSLFEPKVILGDDYKAEEIKYCPSCSSPLEEFFINPETKIYICSDIPSCRYTKIEEGEFAPNLHKYTCPSCSAPTSLNIGRFGKYLKCDACGETASIDSDGNPVPKLPKIEFPEFPCSSGVFVLRQSSAGAFLGSSDFPRCREVKQISVDLIKEYYDRFPPDLQIFATGPSLDPLGNTTYLRYSRIEKTQYIGSKSPDSSGFTNYKAFYVNGKWEDNAEQILKAQSRKKTAAKKTTAKKTTAKKTRTKKL